MVDGLEDSAGPWANMELDYYMDRSRQEQYDLPS